MINALIVISLFEAAMLLATLIVIMVDVGAIRKDMRRYIAVGRLMANISYGKFATKPHSLYDHFDMPEGSVDDQAP